MPEHTIPETLVEQIKAGRAVLVVGAGIGIPSWKKLLENMNAKLAERGEPGDMDASKDVAKLLHKGALARAASFLARTLGEDICDQTVKEMWADIDEIPDIAKALAKIPIRTVWTTFPGEILEKSLREEVDEDWPELQVFTYADANAIPAQGRALVKVLGHFDSFVVVPKSVRRVLTSAETFKDYAKDLYHDATLLFVGFRYGDPDLAALLDRVFGVFEPPTGNHYMIGSGVGPVTQNELESDHHIEVINLPGKGTDETATTALLAYVDDLVKACDAAGVEVVDTRPEADDLSAWISWLSRYPQDDEAIAALDKIAMSARKDKQWETLEGALLAQIEFESDDKRAGLLAELAELYASELKQPEDAFVALTASLREEPNQVDLLPLAEKMAVESQSWSELINETSEIASGLSDKKLSATYWATLGDWYGRYVDRGDYAIASIKQSLLLDPENELATSLLGDALRKGHRWSELADFWQEQAEKAESEDEKVDMYLSLGELCESQLSSVAKATEAYEEAAKYDTTLDSLNALEHLYRSSERLGKLQSVLERKLEKLKERGDDDQVKALKKELTALRSGFASADAGDTAVNIEVQEEVLSDNPDDLEALKALEQLYDQKGNTQGYIRTLERLAVITEGDERKTTLRKLSAELEAVGRWEDAVAKYWEVVELGADMVAYSQIERLLREHQRWYDLVEALERHIASTEDTDEKIELLRQIAEIQEVELDDPHRAIEAYSSIREERESDRQALEALGRLYERTESWERAANLLAECAERNEGEPSEGRFWARAGNAALEAKQEDAARVHLEKATELEPKNVAAAKALARLHKAKENWVSAIQALRRAADVTDNSVASTELLTDAADVADDKLGDEDMALELRLEILAKDPENVEIGRLVVDKLTGANRWNEALPILEMLARKESADRLEKSRLYMQLAQAESEAGSLDRATTFFKKSVESDLDNLGAALGLADSLFARSKKQGGKDLAKEADKAFRQILARHRAGLAESELADIWYKLGQLSELSGESRKAESSYRRALEMEPRHDDAVTALSELASNRGDWKTVVDTKRELLESLEGIQKARLHEEIGDIYVEKLKDPVSGLSAYLEARKYNAGRGLLHKLLDLYSAQKQWRRAVEIVDTLADQESDVERRGKYHYTAAVIARDKLADRELAVEQFNAALDSDAQVPKAFQAIDALLSKAGDYRLLARNYRQQLKRLSQDAPTEQLFGLWSRLGEICFQHLGDAEAAIAAYEVASSLEPGNAELHEHLVELYLAAGPEHRKDAIRELQVLLKQNPDRAELYHALSNLYHEEGELDKEYCLAQALAFLDAANDREKSLFEGHRPENLRLANRRLTEEIWQKSVVHNQEDRHVNAVFSAVAPAISSQTSRPAADYKLSGDDLVDLESPSPVAKLTKYTKDILGLPLSARLFALDRDDVEIQVANTQENGQLAPSILLSSELAQRLDDREMIFQLGKKMSYFRPERFVNYALGTVPKLEAAFEGALEASGVIESQDPDAKTFAGQIQGLPQPVLEQVSVVAQPLKEHIDSGLIPGWRSATDLTANRIGLILCNDLEVAAKAVAVERSGLSTLPAKDRLRDLLAYSVSEEYFAVRRHLGLTID